MTYLCPAKAIENAEAVHLATGDPEFNWKCSQEANNQDLLVSFDPGQDLGMYDTKKLVDVIENTTILFGNHHEIERILDALEVDLTGLRQMGPKIIVKTCGANGCEIYSNEDKIKIDAIPTEAVDPTGGSLNICTKFPVSSASMIVPKPIRSFSSRSIHRMISAIAVMESP